MDPDSQHFAQSLVVCEVSCMYLDTNIVTVKKATTTPLSDALLSTPATSSSSQASAGKYGSLASVVDPRGLYYRLGAVVNKTPRDGVIAAPRKVSLMRSIGVVFPLLLVSMSTPLVLVHLIHVQARLGAKSDSGAADRNPMNL